MKQYKMERCMMNTTSSRNWSCWLSLVAFAVIMLSGSNSNAVNYNWINPSGGSFANTANWNPVGLPGSSDRPDFKTNGTYTVTFPAGTTTTGDTIFDYGGSQYVTLDISSGNTWAMGQMWITSYGTNSVTQISGNLSPSTVTYVGISGTGSGVMIISNGVAQHGNVYVGYDYGSGTWNIAGGTNSLTGSLTLGNASGTTGTVVMTDGSLTATNANSQVGSSGTGTMTLSGGVAQFKQIQAGVTTGSKGTLNIAGGTYSLTGGLYLGPGNGTAVMTGGSLTATNAESDVGYYGTGTMTLSNGVAQFYQITVGNQIGSHGTLNIAGGTNSVMGGGSFGLLLAATSTDVGTVVMTGGSLTATNAESVVGYYGTGTMTLSGGVAQFKRIQVGAKAGSHGTLNIAGGTNSVGATGFYLGTDANATGTVVMTGGSLTETNTETGVGYSGTGTMTISNGAAKFLDLYVSYNSGSSGTMNVIGTNAVITCASYTHKTAGATLAEQFSDGGVSPINCSGLATLKGTLTLGLKGSMAMISSNAIPLIKASSFSGAFTATNSGMFVVTQTSTQVLATINSGYKVAANALGNGAQIAITATNKGWFVVNTNGLAGSTFAVNLIVQTNGTSYTVTTLAQAMSAAGYTVTNYVKYGEEVLTVTLPMPTYGSPSFCWDFSGYDPALKVSQIGVGDLPIRATLMYIQ